MVLLLRWIWWRMNAWAEIAAIVVASAVAPLLIVYLGDDQQPLRLLLAATASTLAALAAIRIKGPEDRARLVAFYRRVRPVGFWVPIAAELGERHDPGPRRLARALGAVALCSVTLFAALLGIGSWLVGSPPPVWLPSAPLWIGGLLVTALALCPLWYRLGFGSRGEP